MKRIYRLVIKTYIGPFLGTFFIAVFVLLMQFLWKYVDDLVGKGLEWYIITELLFYASATFVPMALPLAVLLSSIMSFGILGERYELVAMKAAGISLQKVMYPLVVFIFLISISAFFFSNNVMPVANLKFRSILYDVKQQKLAVLLSSIMSFGSLGERYELVAMKAAGISLQKVMYPLVVLIFLISISAFFFSNNVMPVANLKFRSILYDVKQQKLAFNIKEKIYYKGIDGYVIRVDKKGKDGNSLKKVMIYDHTDSKGNTKITVADSGYMQLSNDQQSMYLNLFDGFNYEEETKDRQKSRKQALQRTYFDKQVVRFDLTGFDLKRTDENLFRNNYHMLNLEQLSNARDSLTEKLHNAKDKVDNRIRREGLYHYVKFAENTEPEQPQISQDTIVMHDTIPDNFLAEYPLNEQESLISLALSSTRRSKNQVEFNGKSINRQEKLIKKHEVEWHRKFTLSVACIVLFFIGAPLGAIIRRGGLGLPLVVSVLFFVSYHVISITGEKYAEAGVLAVHEGMWLATFILLPLGIFLTLKATTDAPLLDVESWKKVFEKWKTRIRK